MLQARYNAIRSDLKCTADDMSGLLTSQPALLLQERSNVGMLLTQLQSTFGMTVQQVRLR